MRVLLLEDEARLAAAYAGCLRREGYAVDEVTTLAATRRAVLEVPYDCLVLDRMVADGDSLQVLPELIADRITPVVMLSAVAEGDDRIAGLARGADDYIAKPVRLDELTLRVRKVVGRRAEPVRRCPIVILGEVVVDLARAEVTRDGKAVHLSPVQYSVFEQLVVNRDRMLTTEELLDHCWDGGRDLFSNPLHSQITRLRTIFRGALRFVAVRGTGYRIEVVEVL